MIVTKLSVLMLLALLAGIVLDELHYRSVTQKLDHLIGIEGLREIASETQQLLEKLTKQDGVK